MFNFFKKMFQKKILSDFSSLIYELLDALRDNKISESEKRKLREKAYKLLLDYGFDVKKK